MPIRCSNPLSVTLLPFNPKKSRFGKLTIVRMPRPVIDCFLIASKMKS